MSDETPPPGDAGDGGEPTPEQIAQMMYERMAATPVPAVLMQTMATFADLAAIRLGYGPEGAEREHSGEARLAIDVLTKLLPIAEVTFGEQGKQMKDAVAELQMAFVQKAQAAGPPPGAGDQAAAGPPPPPPPPTPKIERPPGEGGLWVPPHLR